MPGALSAVDSYLIKVGWVNDPSTAEATLKNVESTIGKFQKLSEDFVKKITAKMQKTTLGNFALKALKFAKTATNAVISIGKAAYETGKAVFDIAENFAAIDLAAERQARLWGITEKSARSYLKALDAMGASSFSDVWKMTDEEFSRFQELQRILNNLEPSKEFQEFAKTTRDISFEVTKFNTQLSSLGNQFMSGLFSVSKDFFYELREDLKAVNEWVNSDGARIAEKVGAFFGQTFKMVSYIYKIFKNSVSAISEFESKTKFLSKSLEVAFTPLFTAYALLEDIIATLAGEEYTYLNARYGGFLGNKDEEGNPIVEDESGNSQVIRYNNGEFSFEDIDTSGNGNGTESYVDEFGKVVQSSTTDFSDWSFFSQKPSNKTYDLNGTSETEGQASNSVRSGRTFNLYQTNNVTVSDEERASRYVAKAGAQLAKQAQEANAFS